MVLWEAFQYAATRADELREAFGQHLLFVAVALSIGIVVCVPLGIWTSRSRAASFGIINGANGLRVIPSLAILFLAIPYFGLSFTAAALALTLLALPPILINTDVAFRGISPAIKEAAYGMGMTGRQVLWRVEVPLALPVILAGIRIAAVEVIASATLAAFIGGGGTGHLYHARLCFVRQFDFVGRRNFGCAVGIDCGTRVWRIATRRARAAVTVPQCSRWLSSQEEQ